jgi:ATP-dependent DNA helicase RecG
MFLSELQELLRNGENSGIEFKRDDVHADSLAKEIAAIANLEGGHILLGVEDDARVSGLTRSIKEAEEWIINICRQNVQPPLIPYWETLPWDNLRHVGVLSIPSDSPDKPYKARRGTAWITFVRVGSTSREATRDEEGRLYQASGVMRYDLRPVPGTGFSDLDGRRLVNYYRDIRRQECPPIEDEVEWQNLLTTTDLMVDDRGRAIPNVGALLLFGRRPKHWLPQAGMTVTAYPGIEKDYAARERREIGGPTVALLAAAGDHLETGLVEQALDFVRNNTAVEAGIDENGRRQDRYWIDYPLEAVREAVVNAVAHRDYTISVADIELSIYQDRLEVISPGRLPNTVTVEGMKKGVRATRNELIKEVLRDYHYIEGSGLGVSRKIIPGMREHNGTEPDLIEEEARFIVRLWK